MLTRAISETFPGDIPGLDVAKTNELMVEDRWLVISCNDAPGVLGHLVSTLWQHGVRIWDCKIRIDGEVLTTYLNVDRSAFALDLLNHGGWACRISEFGVD